MINLDINPAHHHRSNDLGVPPSLKELRPTFKSPQVDIMNKGQRKDAKLHHMKSSGFSSVVDPNLKDGNNPFPNTIPHKSNKIQSLSSNIKVSKMSYQRNSKLNELFGEIRVQPQ